MAAILLSEGEKAFIRHGVEVLYYSVVNMLYSKEAVQKSWEQCLLGLLCVG